MKEPAFIAVFPSFLVALFVQHALTPNRMVAEQFFATWFWTGLVMLAIGIVFLVAKLKK